MLKLCCCCGCLQMDQVLAVLRHAEGSARASHTFIGRPAKNSSCSCSLQVPLHAQASSTICCGDILPVKSCYIGPPQEQAKSLLQPVQQQPKHLLHHPQQKPHQQASQQQMDMLLQPLQTLTLRRQEGIRMRRTSPTLPRARLLGARSGRLRACGTTTAHR